jgi:hypothetical protein
VTKVIRTALTLAAAVAISVLVAEPAWAGITNPPAGSTVSATPTVGGTGSVGHLMDVVAHNLISGSEPGGCTANVGSDGRWSCVVGPVLPPGRYRFVATDVSLPGSPITEVTDVAVDPRALALTPGGDPLPYLLIGVALLLCGAMLMLSVQPVRTYVFAGRHRPPPAGW